MRRRAARCATCQQVQRHNIPITVHCAEYQFDRKKLTFHYSTDVGHPDFRTLLRDGYKQFRCRIWMNNCRPKGTDPGQPLPIQPVPQYPEIDTGVKAEVSAEAPVGPADASDGVDVMELSEVEAVA